MSVYTPLYGPFYPAGGGGTLVNQWGLGLGQGPVGALMPPVAPLGISLSSADNTGAGSGTPTAGNWLFAVVAWRQDAATAGVLQYPSSVNVRDDAHNFWIPVASVPPSTGILRASIWMAPAFRVPQWVFASNTAYQPAITVSVFEVTADVPWYQIAAVTATYTNQGTSVTGSQDPASGLFSVGVLAWDLNTLTVTPSATGWTALTQVTATNESDHTGDITMAPYYATTTGSSMTLAASGTGGNADWAEVLITVHGVLDLIEFPYQASLDLPNWPVLITEMACGQVLNKNYSFNSGITSWTAANNAALAPSPLYTFGDSAGSLAMTPDGVTNDPTALSERIPASPGLTYAATVQVTVPSGYSGGLNLNLVWYNSGGSVISATTLPSGSSQYAVTGSMQQVTATAISPAATASVVFQVFLASTPPATAVTYISYAGFAVPGAFGATADDQIQWTDISGRTITQAGVKIGRGIQYEQQSLEAGTLEIPVANNDGAFTAGNAQSPYYPYAGQTDVPVRMRAIWPASLTPYAPLFTGYTDDVKVQFDDTTLYGYVLVTASDCWSRLTAQMLTASQQEFLYDIPAGSAGGFWPCNDAVGAGAAANLAPTPLPPLAQVTSKYGAGTSAASFGHTNIALAGDPGGTGWALDTLTSADQTEGSSLVMIPPSATALPAMANGITAEFWVFISDASASGITWNGIIAACVNAKGRVWTLAVGAPSGGSSGQIIFSVFDKVTGAATSTTVDPGDNWGTTHFYSVQFTETTWVIYDAGDLLDSGTCNFSPVYDGFVFNGLNVPWQGLSGNCFNGVLQSIALYPLSLPQTRVAAQYFIGLIAYPSVAGETDVQRIPRVIGYGGFVPPLAMNTLGSATLIESVNSLPGQGTPDIDPVTPITDTVGQVVSSYLTNIASSTLAAMFTDGTGALVYRRRLDWYDRPIGLWTFGELAPVPLNSDPNFANLASWQAQNGAAVTQFTDTTDLFPPPFGYAALWHGNGATANPQLEYVPANSIPVTPGQSYQLASWWLSPQGYATGVACIIQWKTSGGSVISTTSSATAGLLANATAYVTVTGQAPAAAATANLFLQAAGTPASTVQFYTGYAALAIAPGEAPYLRNVSLSDDRAQMFNSAVLTQSGTSEKTTFSGTSFNFTPTSGITVTAQNETSAAQRGNVPYTATIYLANSAQLGSDAYVAGESWTAYCYGEGSIEDLASWIVQTLGIPVLRADTAVLTPGSTWQDMTTALFAEVGDTTTLNRRPLGAPETSLQVYLSNIQHEINISDEAAPWVTTYQLSPAPTASILQCDSPVNGGLDGTSLLGW